MYSFEGDFRRKPMQSLRGASQKELKQSLIKRAQDGRLHREDQRKRQSSALKIQKYYRSFAVRKQQIELFRHEFDHKVEQSMSKNVSSDDLYGFVKRLCFIYQQEFDYSRTTFVFQHVLKQGIDYVRYVDKQYGGGLYHLEKLLQIATQQLKWIAQRTEPIALPMRLLEVFTSNKTYDNILISGVTGRTIQHHLLYALIKSGYFECLKCLLNNKVPSSIEKTTTPPTPISSSIFQLIMSPIQCTINNHIAQFNNLVLQSMCNVFLACPFTEQIQLFLLPAMADGQFPFVNLIQSLVCINNGNEQTAYYIPSVYLLSSLVTLSHRSIAQLKPDVTLKYLKLLEILLPCLSELKCVDNTYGESDSEEEHIDIEDSSSLSELRGEIIIHFDSTTFIKCVLNCLEHYNYNISVLKTLCSICHTLLASQQIAIHKIRILYTLAFNTQFVRCLWRACTLVCTATCTGSSTPLLSMLGRGLQMSDNDKNTIVLLLYVFCAMFSHSLLTLHDADFYGDEQTEQLQESSMPFSIDELIPMTRALRDASLGIIDLAHPDAKLNINENYQEALRKTESGMRKRQLNEDQIEDKESKIWTRLFKVVTSLVCQIHDRDTRRPFCSASHWLSNHISIQIDMPSQIYRSHNAVFARRPLGSLRSLCKTSYEDEGPPLSRRDVRNLIVLTELPFVISFSERVKIIQRLIQSDREENQGEISNFMIGQPTLIRRNYIYEDAFEKLSPENESNLKSKLRIQLMNAAGLDEAGIDGGGVFREFLSVLLRTAFDPNRGFFQYSTNRLLYPNPHAARLEDSYTKHLFFIGRMLGKAIYENMLIELPFASFFLAKILSRSNFNLDIHYLQSLDPVMYTNLLSAKNLEDASELGLDFTVVDSGLGETKVVELKPGGVNISVTNDNRIEYIHLMADYKLNKQIRTHCSAFRQGLADVINLEWLQMFNHQELQVLISGSSSPIDIEDLRRNTNYSGGFTDNHSVVELFWKVVHGFTRKQKSQLLKFVTSCSQQPLLGFKDLYPSFCIHDAGQDLDRLPTASTCMNLLKLPHFTDEKLLRSKLLYAIESNAGFELS